LAVATRPTSVAIVADYRAYIIGVKGRIINFVVLDCPDDAAAMESAKQLVDGHDVELWQLGRKVATFKHKPE
jgi:hypothetical protein